MAHGVCTSCGAPLPAPDFAGLITCPTCARVTRSEGPAASSWAPPSPVAGAPAAPPSDADDADGVPGFVPGRRSGGPRVWIVAAAIIAVVGVAVAGGIRSCSSAVNEAIDSLPTVPPGGPSEITLSGSTTVVASTPRATDLVAIVQSTSNSVTERRLALVRFADGTSTKVWASEPLDGSASRAEVAVAGNTLFAAVDDQLYALDAETGATRWTATLHDKATTGCAACFGVVKGNVIVRTTDAYVTAYGTRSSEPLWSKRLESPSGTSKVVGDQVLVVDDREGSDVLTAVDLVDPATGRTIRSTTPTCPRNPQTPWNPEISPDDRIVEIGTQHDVVAAFGFGDACVVRWNPASGATKWTSRLDGASSLSDELQVVGERDLVVSASGGAMVTIDLTTGVARELQVPTDVRAMPDRIVGRTLVADTVTVRGTPKGGLAAWDLGSGDALWAQARLGTAQPTSTSRGFSSDALFDDAPRFELVAEGEGLNVFVFDGTDRTFSVRSVDLDSGDLGPEVKRAFLSAYPTGTPSLTIEGQTATHLVLTIDTRLQAVPVSGRGALVGFPDR